MASKRKDIIVEGHIYHVFNRSVERRPVFTTKQEYLRMLDTMWYYRFTKLPMRYSQLLSLPVQARNEIRLSLEQKGIVGIEIYAFALMPNHFHILVKQIVPHGIPVFLSNISNSYAKYFNVRQKRTGSLWQRPFKAVRIETEEQFIHVSRYIHLNPVSSYIIKEKDLDKHPWTSLPEYLTEKSSICHTSAVLDYFKKKEAYRAFIHDQVEYARALEKIKHLSLDYDDFE